MPPTPRWKSRARSSRRQGKTMQIDLKQYVTHKGGSWKDDPDSYQSNRFKLGGSPLDEVQLSGPLSLRITVAAQNTFIASDGLRADNRESALFSYTLQIPAGEIWTYHI